MKYDFKHRFYFYHWKDRVVNKYEQSSSLGLYELVLFVDVFPVSVSSWRITIDGDVEDIYFTVNLIVEIFPLSFTFLLSCHHEGLVLPHF